MSYQTIVVHVNGSRHNEQRVRLAAQLALDHAAHLVGTAMTGISRFIYHDHAFDAVLTISPDQIDALYEHANASLDRFDAQCRALGVPSYERRLLNDEPEGGLVLQSRYGDLLVVSQPDPDETMTNVVGDLPEFVALNGARPVLVIPYAGRFDSIGSSALVAWDGSNEATRAITGALPLLRRARKVTLAVFNAQRELDTHGEQPGADMALWLARHHVPVEVSQQVTGIDVGNALLSLAADLRSDLLVMGCFGHNRFREVMLGGVTQTVLRSMTLPVLMAH